MASGIYRKAVTALGKIKVFKYPMFIQYQPRGYRVTGEEIERVMGLAKEGDYLIRGYYDYLDSHLIPGFFTHAGYYCGNNKVIHAVSEGIGPIHLIDFCKCDYLAIRRDPEANAEDAARATQRAVALVGGDYDVDFKENNRDQYCTELVQTIWLNRIGLRRLQFRFLWAKRSVFLPDQLYTSPRLTTVFESSEVSSGLKSIYKLS